MVLGSPSDVGHSRKKEDEEVIAKLLFQANFWNQQYQIS
jgi:hypothetical protein